MRVRLRPDDEHVGDRRIGDPHLGAGEHVAALHLLRPRAHAARVRTGVWLGQAEAADPFARGEPGQVLLALLLRAVGVDRVHHEARLDRHGRAVAAVDALDRAGDQAVADVAEAGAAIFRRDGRAEQAELAHLGEDLAVEPLIEIGRGDARLQLLLRIALGRVADEALLVGQLMIEVERIRPVERQDCRLGHEFSPGMWKSRGSLAGALALRQSGHLPVPVAPRPKLRFSVSMKDLWMLRSRSSANLGSGLVRFGRNSTRCAVALGVEDIVGIEADRRARIRAILDERGPVRAAVPVAVDFVGAEEGELVPVGNRHSVGKGALVAPKLAFPVEPRPVIRSSCAARAPDRVLDARALQSDLSLPAHSGTAPVSRGASSVMLANSAAASADIPGRVELAFVVSGSGPATAGRDRTRARP